MCAADSMIVMMTYAAVVISVVCLTACGLILATSTHSARQIPPPAPNAIVPKPPDSRAHGEGARPRFS